MLSRNGWRLVGKSDEHRPRNRESTFATETAPVVTGEKDLAASSKEVGGDAASADRDGHNLVLEAARAALGAHQPSFLPGLASWSPVQAGQVGSSSTSGPGEGTPWTFRGGVFTASLDVEGGTAVAHVGESLIGGDRTLVVAVRGSDDFADAVNGWGPQVQSEYWPAFRPLVNGLVTHAERSGLDRILFTGHSPGGTIAQMMLEAIGGDHGRAVTFGAPGAPLPPGVTTSRGGLDSRVPHLEHGEDLVPGTFDLTSLLDFEKPGERGIIPVNDLTTKADDGAGIFEHSMASYLDDVRWLARAKDSSLDLFTRGSFDPQGTLRVAAGTNRPDHRGGDVGPFGDRLWGLDGNDTVRGFAGADTVFGVSGDDLVRGDQGADWLVGGREADTLRAGIGADSLVGGKGMDLLAAGAGNDRLLGEAGTDRLAGGLGADDFVFTIFTQSPAGSGRDRLVDFQAGVDAIVLAAADANTGSVGN